MADDIDDLLDEVESKYIQEAANKSKNTCIPPSDSVKQVSRKKVDDELEAALEDIFDIPEPVLKGASKEQDNKYGHLQKRCFPELVAGTNLGVGHTTAANARACDNLRCTSCDFKVSWFDNYTWRDQTDYLFLRNNMPTFEKLKRNLSPKRGYRAYACQCHWKSVAGSIEIRTDPNLKWVCGKH